MSELLCSFIFIIAKGNNASFQVAVYLPQCVKFRLWLLEIMHHGLIQQPVIIKVEMNSLFHPTAQCIVDWIY